LASPLVCFTLDALTFLFFSKVYLAEAACLDSISLVYEASKAFYVAISFLAALTPSSNAFLDSYGVEI
jgi:hypothetical protein